MKQGGSTMAGRKKLPTNLHVLKGTDRADRRNPNEPKPENKIPSPPDILKGGALEEWKRITVELDRLGLITEIDRTALSMYCQAYGRWIRFEKILEQTGEINEETGQTSPAMWVVNKSIEQCHKLLTEFGMTPSSRSKVSSSKKDDGSINPWDKFAKNA